MFYAHKKPAAVRPANAADCNMKSDGKFWKQGSEHPLIQLWATPHTQTRTQKAVTTPALLTEFRNIIQKSL